MDDIIEELLSESEFFHLYAELVAMVYATDKSDRLGIVRPTLIERYGKPESDTYDRIETHVLRTVAWIEYWDDKGTITPPVET